MNNRTSIYFLLLLLILQSSCRRRHKLANFPTYSFVVDTIYPSTQVKKQGKSSNCWAYAVASLWETETIMATGDTIQLSPEYIVRSKYLMQFDHYYNTQGKDNICKGGLGHSAINAFRKYGSVPMEEYDSCYYNQPDYPSLLKDIRKIARKAVRKPSQRDDYQRELSFLLDNRMGMVPNSFLYHNQTYTPQTFAAQLPAYQHKYVELTSFSNQPYYTYCVLELPDNWESEPFYNLPMEQWIDIMIDALRNGYTFTWDGDVSEPSFSMRHGFAFCEPGTIVNDQARLSAFLSGKTTDDHMMHVVGLAYNQYGERFFIAKNSYGAIGPFKGYIYLSEDYVRMKTISILINKEYFKSSLKEEEVSYGKEKESYRFPL